MRRRIFKKLIVKPESKSISNRQRNIIQSTIKQTPIKLDKPQTNFSKVNPIFNNETCFIIGGGPSLTGFNFDLLKNRKVMAINKAYESYPNADILFWSDTRFWNWFKEDIIKFHGLKYTISLGSKHDSVINLARGGRHGLSKTNTTLVHGDNSGYAALNLAYLLGFSKIVLLGYDMTNLDDQSHFHSGYESKPVSNDVYTSRFMLGFPIIADLLKKEGVRVYNASPISKLTCFEKITIEQALNL